MASYIEKKAGSADIQFRPPVFNASPVGQAVVCLPDLS
jgi:hypothetical protein